MGKHSDRNRRDARRAASAARGALQTINQTEVLARHTRQQDSFTGEMHTPYDEWLDSSYDYEAFGKPVFAKRDDNGEIATDVWPSGFRGQLGVDNRLILDGYTRCAAHRKARHSKGEIHVTRDEFNMSSQAYKNYRASQEENKDKAV